jgi:hypothetical protein
VHVNNERIIYGDPDGEMALREVDQSLSFYTELDLNETLGVQLNLEVPIECKMRANVELFGFAEDNRQRPFAVITTGDLAASELGRTVGRVEPDYLDGTPLAYVTLLEQDRNTPSKVSEEHLIYKGGAALLDFIRFSTAATIAEDKEDPVLVKMGLLADFEAHLKVTHYHWSHVARRWMAGVDVEVAREFSQLTTGGRHTFYMLQLALPVLCVDSPFYAVKADALGRIEGFSRANRFLTSLRAVGWPGQSRRQVTFPSPEAVVTVTNYSGLAELLPSLHRWCQTVISSLKNLSPDTTDRAMFEAAFMDSVRFRYGQNNTERQWYRSDWERGELSI